MRNSPIVPLRRTVAASLACLLAVTLAATVDTPAGAVPDDPFAAWPRPPRVESVPGHDLTALPVAPDAASAASRHRVPAPVWPKPGSADVTLPPDARTTAARAGALPVRIGPAQGQRSAVPASVEVELLGRKAATRAGVAGLLLKLRRSDGVHRAGRVSLTVDYSSFRSAYGGDWASRLRLVDLDTGTPLATDNDLDAGRVTAQARVTGTARTLALAATDSGGTGDYTATSLSPSGSWQVNAASGDFTWSYAMRTPPTPGGLAPGVTATYSSGTVDGRTASTNNQSSWIGEGWNMWPGFIERSYKSCADDTASGSPKTGDQCWGTRNATMSFGGTSSKLVYDAGRQLWRPEADDGSRVEHLTGAVNGDNDGEYWRITTTDGTHYYFGRNQLPGWTSGKPVTASAWTVPVFGNDAGDPCHGSSFAASHCTQAYRWNLDYVVDAHGNSISYYYARETNGYGLNLGKERAVYTRGGTLVRAEYGTRNGQEYAGDAPARVVFDSADRCKPGTTCAVHTGSSWPDVPWDRSCTAGTCPNHYAPTFWSTKRLATVTTQVRDGSDYRDVDRWTFDHAYPDPGDETSPTLWLKGITHTGLVAGSAALPAVTFGGSAMPNRVDSSSDGLPPLDKYRIDAVNTESGGVLNVHYAAPDCSRTSLPAPGTNTRRCFPVRWVMEPEPEPRDDWFHKYVVDQVTQVDRVGNGETQVTNYEYLDDAAWHYDDNPLVPADRRTWSQWRGYEKVLVTSGDPAQDPDRPRSATRYQYFRGMDGDHKPGGGTKSVLVTDSTGTPIADIEPLAGFLREEITYDGDGGPEVTGSIHDPWTRGPTAIQGSLKAYQVEETRATTRTALDGDGDRTTRVDTTYDHEGNPTKVDDHGDLSTTADDQCTTITYARDTGSWLLTLPSHVRTVGVACGGSPDLPADAIADVRTYYDGHATVGAAPTAGDKTKTEEAASYSDGTPSYVTTSTATYDAYGRVLDSYDALDRKTSAQYQPATGPATTSTVTDALGHTVTTTLEPAWGQPLATVDANGRRTDLTYDPLGRLTAVWLPGRSKADDKGPNTRYAYGVRTTGPSWVRTETLEPKGNYATSYALLDGFLRPRQTQSPSPRGGRLLTDTLYDSRGLTWRVRNAYYNDDSAPGTTLFEPVDKDVPNTTLTKYDGAERPVSSHYMKLNVEQRDWRATTEYHGDHVDVTPPLGGTATSTYTDARGQTTQLRQYRAATPSGDYDATTYAYTKAGDLATVTDPAGNTWHYSYDVRGRQVGADDPDHGQTAMTYDAAGQLLSTTDARGRTVTASYDALGRKVATHLGSAADPVATWTYDTLSKGALTSSTRYDHGHAYTRAVTGYDDAGRPTGESVTIPESETGLAGTYKTTMTYHADGSHASVGMPALGDLSWRETVVQDYDAVGLPTKLTGRTTYVGGTDYTAYGEPYQVTLGAADKRVQRTYWYEEGTRRLSKVLTLPELTLRAHRLSYGYDPAGNVMSVSAARSGQETDTQCFGYDHLRRMTQAWTQSVDLCADAPRADEVDGPAPYWLSYTYDRTGNRTSQVRHGLGGADDSATTYDYPAPGQPQPHTLSSAHTTGPDAEDATYEYDAAGNTTSRPGPGGPQELAWSTDGSLDTISTAASTTSYVYDADGNQLIRRDPGSATLFVGAGELTVDTATGAAHGTRYYGSTAVRTSAGVSWLVADQHNTAQLAIDADSHQATTRRFDPFGNPRGTEGTWPGGERGFVGGTQNHDTGLTRLGAREYDPATGRFISVDPLIDTGDPQQMNGYAYANNNPATMTDPDGRMIFEGNDSGGIDSHGTQAIKRASAKAGTRSHSAAAAAARLDRPILGKAPEPWVIDRFRDEYDYRGSNRFTYADGIAFAAKGAPQFDIVCQALGRPVDECGNHDPIGDALKAFATFLYELTPIADLQHCIDGSQSCLWLLTDANPFGKVAKVAKIAADAAAAAKTGPTRFVVDSSGETTMFLRASSTPLEVREHAARRMTERGISIDAAESTLAQKPFQYFHKNVWKTGYYDPASRLFIGTVDGQVTTVIARAKPKYINNLKAARP